MKDFERCIVSAICWISLGWTKHYLWALSLTKIMPTKCALEMWNHVYLMKIAEVSTMILFLSWLDNCLTTHINIYVYKPIVHAKTISIQTFIHQRANSRDLSQSCCTMFICQCNDGYYLGWTTLYNWATILICILLAILFNKYIPTVK